MTTAASRIIAAPTRKSKASAAGERVTGTVDELRADHRVRSLRAYCRAAGMNYDP